MVYTILFLAFFTIILGIDAAKTNDYDSNLDLFDFAVSSVIPIIVLVIYGPGKEFTQTIYYFIYSNILLFITQFLYPFILFRIRQDINTPLWIQIFYAVIGILEFISTSYILGIKLFGTKCMWFFQFFLTLAPFWIMLVPQVSLIIIFWETISTTIHYPTIILGFLIELLIIKLLYKKISLTYSINFVMSINQAVVLITIYCNNTYLTKALLALTTLVVTRILDYFSTEITKKSHFHPFGCFLKEVYNAFDLVNSEKCPKIKRFIESNMKDFAVNESIDENSKGDDDGKPKDDEKSKGDENFKRDSKSKEEIDNEIV